MTSVYKKFLASIPRAAGKGASKQSQMLADSEARHLYIWAKTHLPNIGHEDKSESPNALSEPKKLGAMACIVGIAYSVRVMKDAHMVKSHSLRDKDVREAHLKQGREMVDDAVDLLRAALMAIVRVTSLLEVATDYHQPVATYMTLIGRLQASRQTIGKMSETVDEKRSQVWDDGLSKIR